MKQVESAIEARFTVHEGESKWRCVCGGCVAHIKNAGTRNLVVLPAKYDLISGVWQRTNRPHYRTQRGREVMLVANAIKAGEVTDFVPPPGTSMEEALGADAPCPLFLMQDQFPANVRCPGCRRVCIIPSVKGFPE